MKRNRSFLLLSMAAVLALSGCSQATDISQQNTPETQSASAVSHKAENIDKITQAGSYVISGSSPVTVDAKDKEVELVLENALISSENQPAIYVKAAKRVKLTVPAGTKSALTVSADDKNAEDNKASSAVYSKAPMDIEGEGELTLVSQNGLGIKCKETISVKDITLSVTSCRSSLSADTLNILSGNITLAAGNGKEKGKGMKADTALNVSGGNISVITNNDAFHSSGQIILSGGNITLNADDDAVHADKEITVSGGEIAIVKCSEGMEAPKVTVSGGDISITASDDGINATKGDGRDTFMRGDDSLIAISGGNIFISSKGDGIDSNGSISMTGGNVTVSGPDSDKDSALDFDGKFSIDGGSLIAYGSAGMAQAPEGGKINTVCITADMKAGEPVTVMGAETVTVVPEKDCRSLVISDPRIKTGESYTVTAGTADIAVIEINSTLTYAGERMGFGGGRPPFGQGGRPDFGDRKKPDFDTKDMPDFDPENMPEPPDFGGRERPDFDPKDMPDFDPENMPSPPNS